MTLKQLEAFYRAATCESFAIAAQRLHVSVSTLSKRIADLEAHLGKLLFNREQYRATLTPAGQSMLPRVSLLLNQAEELRHTALESEGVQGNIRFAVGELASLTWLPRFMVQAAHRYPNLNLEPHVDTGHEMEIGVERGELDFAVVSGTSSRQRLVSHYVGEAEFCWMVAPALIERSFSLTEFSNHSLPLITMPSGAGTHRMLEPWIKHNGIVWGQRLTCNTWGAVSSLLLEGIGVGFLPRAWAEPLSDRGLLVHLKNWPALSSLYYSLQMRSDDTRPSLLILCALLNEVVNFDLPIRFLSSRS